MTFHLLIDSPPLSSTAISSTILHGCLYLSLSLMLPYPYRYGPFLAMLLTVQSNNIRNKQVEYAGYLERREAMNGARNEQCKGEGAGEGREGVDNEEELSKRRRCFREFVEEIDDHDGIRLTEKGHEERMRNDLRVEFQPLLRSTHSTTFTDKKYSLNSNISSILNITNPEIITGAHHRKVNINDEWVSRWFQDAIVLSS